MHPLFRKLARQKYIFLVFALFYLFFNASSVPDIDQSAVVVSLTSVPSRLAYELPITLASLLRQSLDKAVIHIFYAEDKREVFEHAIEHTPLFRHPRLRWIATQDIGPAKKFIPILKSFSHSSKTVVVCDDDHYYSYRVLETLATQLMLLNASVAISGWRIRQDFEWGVSTTAASRFSRSEFYYHVIYGWRITKPYQVGIMTGNKAYAFKSSWMDVDVLSDYSTAPSEARMVDDIWLNGHLSMRGVKRYIVPIWDVSVDVTKVSAVEATLAMQKSSRAQANDIMLKYFRSPFEKEEIGYVFGGAEGPTHGWFVDLYIPLREWFLLKWIS